MAVKVEDSLKKNIKDEEELRQKLRELHRESFIANKRRQEAIAELKSRINAGAAKAKEMKKPRLGRQFLTRAQAAMIMMLSEQRVHDLIRSGKLKDLHPVSIAEFIRLDVNAHPMTVKHHKDTRELCLSKMKAWEESKKLVRENLARNALEVQ